MGHRCRVWYTRQFFLGGGGGGEASYTKCCLCSVTLCKMAKGTVASGKSQALSHLQLLVPHPFIISLAISIPPRLLCQVSERSSPVNHWPILEGGWSAYDPKTNR